MTNNLLLIGKVLSPHSCNGNLKCFLDLVDLNMLIYCYIQSQDKYEQITILRQVKENIYICRCDNAKNIIEDIKKPDKEMTMRDFAEYMKGLKIYIKQEDLPSTEDQDDTFYFHQIQGSIAITNCGKNLGMIKCLHNFGAGTIVELKDQTLPLIPFDKHHIKDINLEKKTVTLLLPDMV